jgi:hypothetical protein
VGKHEEREKDNTGTHPKNGNGNHVAQCHNYILAYQYSSLTLGQEAHPG